MTIPHTVPAEPLFSETDARVECGRRLRGCIRWGGQEVTWIRVWRPGTAADYPCRIEQWDRLPPASGDSPSEFSPTHYSWTLTPLGDPF